MAISVAEFNKELYEEHLEEASFLYEQRRASIVDPEISWLDVDDFEGRLEAHIDALIVGGKQALQVCTQRGLDGDAGELFAAVCVFCRQRNKDRVFEILRDFDDEEPDNKTAIADALILELPAEWTGDLLRIIVGRHQKVIPVLARTLGHRRTGSADVLARVLQTAPDDCIPDVIWALGRLGDTAARGILSKCVRSEDPAVCEAASLALARMGDEQPIKQGLLLAQLHDWPAGILGIGGGRSAVSVLRDVVRSGNATQDTFIALGLLGDCSAVSVLVDGLSNPETAPFAAMGLQLITGAQLYEDVFVPEEVDPDELFDDERREFEEAGKVPSGADGRPFGSNVTQLSINPTTWRAWLENNKNGFDPDLRYRYGKPYSPISVLETLAARFTPHRVRALAAEELKVRFDAAFPYEPDMPVYVQKSRIHDMSVWLQSEGRKFKPGVWYFAGKAV